MSPVPRQRLFYGPPRVPVRVPLALPEYPLTEAGGPMGLKWPERRMDPYRADPTWWQRDLDDLESDSPAMPDLTERQMRIPGL